MSELSKVIEGLAAIFGPVAAVCLLLVATVGWIYRRDVLHQRSRAFEILARSDTREDRLVQIVERNAISFERTAASQETLARAIAGSNDNLAKTMDRLADSIRDAEAVRGRNLEMLLSLVDKGRS